MAKDIKPADGPPEFPVEFVARHCWKVAEARSWRQNFRLPPDPEDDAAYAECAFHPAGGGLKCEACELFLTRPFCGHELDKKWLPKLETYYRDLAAWEIEEEKRRAIESNNGSYI